VGVELYAATVSDPPVVLGLSGNQNQSLDCDKNSTESELAFGCGNSYTKNTGTACPTQSGWHLPSRGSASPLHGEATNEVSRYEPANPQQPKPNTCTAPNQWSSFPNLPIGDLAVPVF
jgi:hypothetical protein